jgi:hypothetical protein
VHHVTFGAERRDESGGQSWAAGSPDTATHSDSITFPASVAPLFPMIKTNPDQPERDDAFMYDMVLLTARQCTA